MNNDQMSVEEADGWSKVQYTIGYKNGFIEGKRACLSDLIATLSKDKRPMIPADSIINQLVKVRDSL